MPISGPAASLPKYLNPILRPVARWLSSEEIISTVHARRAPMMHASAGLAL